MASIFCPLHQRGIDIGTTRHALFGACKAARGSVQRMFAVAQTTASLGCSSDRCGSSFACFLNAKTSLRAVNAALSLNQVSFCRDQRTTVWVKAHTVMVKFYELIVKVGCFCFQVRHHINIG